MTARTLRWPLLVAALTLPTVAVAHFTIATVNTPFGRKDAPIELELAFGHPFEGDRAAARRPAAVRLHAPSGAVSDLAPSLTERAEGEARSWQVAFTPTERGDHVILVEGAPHAHDGKAYLDLTKLVVNVSGVQQGWDRVLGLPAELEPLTRPYGLEAGTTFRARALVDGKPAPGVHVELEYLNATPPAEVPPEPFVTRVEKTGADGELVVTLDRAGWWILAFGAPAGEVELEGQTLPQRARAALWVYVGR